VAALLEVLYCTVLLLLLLLCIIFIMSVLLSAPGPSHERVEAYKDDLLAGGAAVERSIRWQGRAEPNCWRMPSISWGRPLGYASHAATAGATSACSEGQRGRRARSTPPPPPLLFIAQTDECSLGAGERAV